jgi:hypothetical protein
MIMKFMEISAEVEQALVAVLDIALKSGGMSVLAHIDKVRNAIKMQESSDDLPK